MALLLSLFILISAAIAVSAKLVMHRLLALIGGFLFLGMLSIVKGLEYPGFTVILVYVGAISVLFLFIVMMVPNPRVDLPHDGSNQELSIFSHSLPVTLWLLIIGTTVLAPLFWDAPQKPIISCQSQHWFHLKDFCDVMFNQHPLLIVMLGVLLMSVMVGIIAAWQLLDVLGPKPKPRAPNTVDSLRLPVRLVSIKKPVRTR